jgi:hypothetical protein
VAAARQELRTETRTKARKTMNRFLPTEPGTQFQLMAAYPPRGPRAFGRHIIRHVILRRKPGWGCAYHPSPGPTQFVQLAAQPAAARAGAAEISRLYDRSAPGEVEISHLHDRSAKDLGQLATDLSTLEDWLRRGCNEDMADVVHDAWALVEDLYDDRTSTDAGLGCACGDQTTFGAHTVQECCIWPNGLARNGMRIKAGGS